MDKETENGVGGREGDEDGEGDEEGAGWSRKKKEAEGIVVRS